MSEFSKTAVELKDEGNTAFSSKNYAEAEKLYASAIALDSNVCAFFTNLSAAQFHQNKFEESLSSAECSLALDQSWAKGYFRKAAALESLGRTRECFYTWRVALSRCGKEHSGLINKQLAAMKGAWLVQFKQQEVVSISDLLSRFELLSETRARLSTLVHFWNASTQQERRAHFLYFLGMIGGDSVDMEELEELYSEQAMVSMPTHNYTDYPREAIEPWCAFLEGSGVAAEGKTAVFAGIWRMLTGKEQTMVIVDLQTFLKPEEGVARVEEVETQES